jgi:hypothetical protein
VKLTASSIVFATGSSIATASGNVVVETASLTLDGSIATSGASLTLIADSLTISANGIIDGDANTVTIRPQSAGTAVNLGSDDASGILGLTLSEVKPRYGRHARHRWLHQRIGHNQRRHQSHG